MWICPCWPRPKRALVISAPIPPKDRPVSLSLEPGYNPSKKAPPSVSSAALHDEMIDHLQEEIARLSPVGATLSLRPPPAPLNLKGKGRDIPPAVPVSAASSESSHYSSLYG